MNEEYDLAVVRELLSASFSSSEIDTLAFDLLYDVYQDFSSSMTKSRRIELIVVEAHQNGGLPDLVNYVQRKNPYQYERFRDRLRRPVAVPEPEEPAWKGFDYVLEGQPWYAPDFPLSREIDPEEAEGLSGEIDVVIMTATLKESKAVMRLLEPYPRRKDVLQAFIGAETYYLGKFGAHKVVATECAMGAGGGGGSALAAEQALRVWRPKALIMPGLAFGKDPVKQEMADVLVASQIIPYEKQRVGQNQVIFRDPIPPSNPTLLNRFVNARDWRFDRPDGARCKLRSGPLLSGEKLVDDPAFKARLFEEFPNAIGGEMEGAGIAAASSRANAAWILVKAICDWADGRKNDRYQPLAAAAAVSLVHHVLSKRTVLQAIHKIQL